MTVVKIIAISSMTFKLRDKKEKKGKTYEIQKNFSGTPGNRKNEI